MATADEAVLAAIGAVALAFFLWALTNLHLRRGVNRVRLDIESKRLETFQFVEGQIGRIERQVAEIGGHISELRAQAPPGLPPDILELPESFESMRTGILEAFKEMGGDIRSLPARMAQYQGTIASVEQRQVQAMLKDVHEGDLNDAVAVKEAVLAGDPEMIRLAAMKKVAEFSMGPEEQKKHPLLSLAVELGKPMVLDFLDKGSGAARGGVQTHALPSPKRSNSDF